MALEGTLTVLKLVLVCFGFIFSLFFFFQVKEEMLFEALTTRKTVTVGEKLIVPYKLSEVSCSRRSSDLRQEWRKNNQILDIYEC